MAQLFNGLTLEEAVHLRKMNPLVAEMWLDELHPELTPDQRELWLDIARKAESTRLSKTVPASVKWERYRNRFVAAAWLAGASWAQIATLFGSRRQSVAASVERILPSSGRQALRYNQIVSNEKLSAMRDAYIVLCNELDSRVTDISLLELRDKLLHAAETVYSEDEVNELTESPTLDRKMPTP